MRETFLKIQIIEFMRLIRFDRLNSIQFNWFQFNLIERHDPIKNKTSWDFFSPVWIWCPHNFRLVYAMFVIIIICQSIRVNCDFFLNFPKRMKKENDWMNEWMSKSVKVQRVNWNSIVAPNINLQIKLWSKYY